jgi:hypothetical protein
VQVVVTEVAYTKMPIANAGNDQTVSLPLNVVYLDGSGSLPNGWTDSAAHVTYAWTKVSGPAQYSLGAVSLPVAGYNVTTVIAKDLISGVYLFAFRVTNAAGEFDEDTVRVDVVDDPVERNTVTYHELSWALGDVYGLGESLQSLSTPIRPDLFNSGNAQVQVGLKLNSSSPWVSVPFRGSDRFSYDQVPIILWILCDPVDPLLVGTTSSIKIKLP